MNKYLLEMYKDYRNNFLTVKCFSERYGISEKLAKEIINECRDYLSPNQQVDYLHKGYKDCIVLFKDFEVIKQGEKLNAECCVEQLKKLVEIDGNITVSQNYLNLAKNVKQGYFITNKENTVFVDAVNQCFVNVEYINFSKLN